MLKRTMFVKGKGIFEHIDRVPFQSHLILAFLVRLALTIYGELHDIYGEVQYTDVDYKVVTDGARYVLANESPFKRHTFRYSPILAIILTPNVSIHNCFGKILFCGFDILVAILLEQIIRNELLTIFEETAIALLKRQGPNQQRTIKIKNIHLPTRYERWAKWGALFWLYNPLAFAISTRGNGDSISSFVILASMYFLQKHHAKPSHSFLAGICHGFAVHIRIYPIVFSLAYYLSLAQTRGNLRALFQPNKKQILLVAGAALSFTTLTGLFYLLYGYEFLYEAYIYHFVRKDTRHNFSLYFLMQYINTDVSISIFEKLLTTLPQLLIILYFTVSFGQNLRTLSFCVFGLTFVSVTYNTVVTSQYFVWYLALLPLCFKNLRNLPTRLAVAYFSLWILAQGLWLLPAYLLEFKTLNTFHFIGIQSVAFFFVNIFILQRLIYYFDVISRIK